MAIHEKINTLDKQLQHFVARVYASVPYHMPSFIRRAIAAYIWIVASVAGILQMISALMFLEAGHRAEEAIQTTTYLSRIYGASDGVGAPDFFFYVALVFACLLGILTLLAVPALRRLDKMRGWSILFYTLILNIIYGFIRTISEIDGGLFHSIVAVVISAAGMYVLFEIMPYFLAKEIKKEDV